MGYDNKRVNGLFDPPRGRALAPQDVARRIVKVDYLPRHTRDQARVLSLAHRKPEWSDIEKLAVELDTASHAINDKMLDDAVAIDYFVLRVLLQSNMADHGRRGHICDFCHRPALQYRHRAEWVRSQWPYNEVSFACREHAPGTPGGKKVYRMARWAGSFGALRDKIADKAIGLRQKPLPTLAFMWEMEKDSVTQTARILWEKRPASWLPWQNEIAIRILAWRQVDMEYQAFIKHAKKERWVAVGKQAGHKGGRPKCVARSLLTKAARSVGMGASVRAAAREHGVSEPTLRRYLKHV